MTEFPKTGFTIHEVDISMSVSFELPERILDIKLDRTTKGSTRVFVRAFGANEQEARDALTELRQTIIEALT